MTCPACGRTVEELNYSHAAGAVVCLDCHLDAAPPPTRGPQDVAVGKLERHTRQQEAKRVRILERAPPGALERLAAEYKTAGLRPVIDPVLEVVLVDCERCGAQDTDPLGIYRPMRVVPRARETGDGKPAGSLLVLHCDACEFHDERPV